MSVLQEAWYSLILVVVVLRMGGKWTTKVGIKAKVVVIAEVEAGVAAVPVRHRTPTKTFTRKRPRKDSRVAPTSIDQKHIFAVTSDKMVLSS